MNRSVSVTGVNTGYIGFGMKSSNPIRYYVTNSVKNKIYVFDENWNFVLARTSFSFVNYIVPVGNYCYITGNSNLWKTDEQFNKLIQYNSTGSSPVYFGLYYSSTNNLIYVAPNSLSAIQVFNLNLRLNNTISLATHYPWSINGRTNQLYVGTSNGVMLVIENKHIIKQYNACKGQNIFVNSILFDQFDKIATACYSGQLYLYNSTGNYLNKYISTNSTPWYIGFDSKSRLVVVQETLISLYN